MNEDTQEIMLDLLYKQAVYGLTEEETKQLRELQSSAGSSMDAHSLEMTAAAIGMINLPVNESMPAHLQAKIFEDANKFFGHEGATETGNGFGDSARSIVATSPTPSGSFWNWFGWAVAATACVALALNLYFTRIQPREVVQEPRPIQTPAPQPPSLSEQRQQLLASAGDVVTRTWSDFKPEIKMDVQGDVVWSNSQQKGFLRFTRIPANDKSKETYQLWIFDKEQKHPVDGGVFDVGESGEIIIPIDAKIAVKEPTMFGVTAEKPGGVVVSELGKVMAVAKV